MTSVPQFCAHKNHFDRSVYTYGTDLMQRRTRIRVIGYHSLSARTRSSVSFNGLELGLDLELERKLARAVQQTINDTKGAIDIDY